MELKSKISDIKDRLKHYTIKLWGGWDYRYMREQGKITITLRSVHKGWHIVFFKSAKYLLYADRNQLNKNTKYFRYLLIERL